MHTLQQILNLKKFSKRELAEVLFKESMHQLMTFNRVLSGARELSVEEFKRLADFTGLPLGFLVTGRWEIHSNEADVISFVKGDVIFKLNTKNWLVIVNQFIGDQYVPVYRVQAENAPLKVFLADLTALIISQNSIKLKSIKNE